MNLAELSLKRPVTAIMFFVSMVAIGLIAATRLPLEQFPDLEVPFLFVDVLSGLDAGGGRARAGTPDRGGAVDTLGHPAHAPHRGPTARRSSCSSSGAIRWRSRRSRRARRSTPFRKDLPSDLQRYQGAEVLHLGRSDPGAAHLQ